MSDTDSTAGAPDLDVRVIRGAPTDEELAAVVAVLTAVASAPRKGPAPMPAAPSAWERSRRGLRAPLHPGIWR